MWDFKHDDKLWKNFRIRNQEIDLFFLNNFVSAVSPAKLVDVISSVKLLNETVVGKNGFPRHI